MKINELEERIKILDLIDKNKLKSIGGNRYFANPCPVCGHKDHFFIDADTNSFSSYSGCCVGGKAYQYLLQVESLDEETAFKKLKQLAGAEGFTINNKSKTNVDSPKIHVVEDAPQADHTDWVMEKYNQQTPADWDYFFKRKISLPLIEKYKLCVYVDSHGEKRAILPVWQKGRVVSYTGRSINENGPKYHNSRGTSEVFNGDIIESAQPGKIIFLTEGVFDALTFEVLGYKSVACGGTGHAGKVKTIIDGMKDKPLFIVFKDSDKAGEEFVKTLNLKNVITIPVPYKDINEWMVDEDDEDVIKVYIDKFISKIKRPDSAASYLVSRFIDDQKNYLFYRNRKTGFRELDEELDGFQAGLYVLGGVSSVGKTTFIHQMSDQLAQQGEHIIYYSLEQSAFELISKSLARLTARSNGKKGSNVTAREVKSGDITDFFKMQSLDQAQVDFMKFAGNINIIEGNFGTTEAAVRDYVTQYIYNNNTKPVVVIDYLQILQNSDPRINANDKQRTDSNLTALKRMSRDLDISVIVVSSLNRANYMTVLDFESFKESGGIEYTADYLLGLQLAILNDELFDKQGEINKKREKIRAAKESDPRSIQLISLKNRNGKANFTCDFLYNPKMDYFEELWIQEIE